MLADGRVITINMRPKAEVVPIKRDVLMVATPGLNPNEMPKSEPVKIAPPVDDPEKPKRDWLLPMRAEKPNAEAIEQATKLKAEERSLLRPGCVPAFHYALSLSRRPEHLSRSRWPPFRTFGVSFSYDKFRDRLLVGGHALKQWVGELGRETSFCARPPSMSGFGGKWRPEVTKDGGGSVVP